MIVVEPLQSSQSPEFEQLYQLCFPQKTIHREKIERVFTEEPSRVWGAFEEGELVGFLYVWVVKDEVQVIDVGVHPESRQKGIAKGLLVHLIKESSAMGITLVTLEVHENNLGAQSLYRSCSFLPAGRRKAYYTDGGDALLYSLKI